MATPPHLLFLEQITRKLSNAFQEVHQLCLEEIERNRLPQQAEEIPVDELEQIMVNPVEPQSAEEGEKEAQKEAEKESKTKKIRKEDEQKGRRKGKAVSHKPKAPASSFLQFFKHQQANISRTYPSYGVTELTKIAAKCWKELSNEEKQPYIKQCDDQRKIYQQKMEQYRLEFPEEVAEKEKARKPAKKERKTSPNVSTPKKEKDGQPQDNNEPAHNGSIMVVGEEASESDSEQQMDSLGV